MARSSKMCETWCVIGHHAHKLKKFGKWLFEVAGNNFGSVCTKFDNDIMFYCWENAVKLMKEPKNTLFEKNPFKLKNFIFYPILANIMLRWGNFIKTLSKAYYLSQNTAIY